ncbi:MAG: hypothetical protein LQ352_004842 [Teloschistes flavicans]|nr:MAG: hypothetical protein LQ352_004842 [Teloschistes flavicans]
MVAFLSHLNPIPGFPSYTGPYKVGTADVEIPAAELPSPSPTPDPNLTTVSFRIFYPCEPPTKPPKSVYWLPDPQHEYLGAYTRFLGASRRLSGFLRNLPFFRILSYTTIPAISNATILQAPTKNKRWPVMVFSHGLGGTKNAYSHLLGSISSHGVVVIAADHRDGSAPLSCIRDKPGTQPRYVEYHSISHRQSPEVEQARDDQLRIRLWELGMIHEALLKIDRGEPLLNTLAEPPTNTMNDLATFQSALDVHTPGSIAWSGHSFGAATVVQFLKSVFYHPSSRHAVPSSYKPLFQPSSSSQIAHQITPSSPLTLLDLWAMPLLSTSTQYLHSLPLPCYTQPSSASTPGPKTLLVILSEAFYKWDSNLTNTKRAISANPSSPHTPENKTPRTQPQAAAAATTGPYIFYPLASAHLSQSDFGILFPYLTRKAFKASDPARTLRLNTRAVLEVLRRCGWEVADTSAVDMEEEKEESLAVEKVGGHGVGTRGQDAKILRGDGSVRGWVSLDVEGSRYKGEAANEETSETADPMEAVVQGELTKL